MKRPNPWWYYAALGLALVPAGARALTWKTSPIPEPDPVAVTAGKLLFTHEWAPNDPLAKGGDGLGPVFNAKSCVACHASPTPGGASGLEHNVTMYTVLPTKPGESIRQGVVHASASSPRYQETLKQVDPGLPDISQPQLVRLSRGIRGRTAFGFEFTTPGTVVLSQRNTPALYGAKLIDEIPDRAIIAEEKKQQLQWGLTPASTQDLPVGRALRLPDGRIGKFGWKAQSGSLLEFVQAACANELGLGNPSNPQPKPISRPDFVAKGLDLTTEQCVQMRDFVYALNRPIEKPGAEQSRVAAGRELFMTIGCAHCHTPKLGSIEGLYSDMLLHRMGADLQGGGFYYGEPTPLVSAASLPSADEWRTPPLWGIADSGPWLHDGRAATLAEAIELHGGQASRAAAEFSRLQPGQQATLVAFLKSLRAPQ